MKEPENNFWRCHFILSIFQRLYCNACQFQEYVWCAVIDWVAKHTYIYILDIFAIKRSCGNCKAELQLQMKMLLKCAFNILSTGILHILLQLCELDQQNITDHFTFSVSLFITCNCNVIFLSPSPHPLLPSLFLLFSNYTIPFSVKKTDQIYF